MVGVDIITPSCTKTMEDVLSTLRLLRSWHPRQTFRVGDECRRPESSALPGRSSPPFVPCHLGKPCSQCHPCHPPSAVNLKQTHGSPIFPHRRTRMRQTRHKRTVVSTARFHALPCHEASHRSFYRETFRCRFSMLPCHMVCRHRLFLLISCHKTRRLNATHPSHSLRGLASWPS